MKFPVVCCAVSEPLLQDQLVQTYEFSGFPVVQEEMFLGFVGREKLRLTLGLSHLILASPMTLTVSVEQLLSDRSPTELTRECTFSRTYAASEPNFIDLSSVMEVSVLELRTEVPLELVVNMIHKMVRLFFLLFFGPSTSRATCHRTWDRYFSHNEGSLWV